MGSCHVLMHRKLISRLLTDEFKDQIAFKSMSLYEEEVFQCLVESPKLDAYLGQCCVVVEGNLHFEGQSLRFTRDEDFDIGAGRGFKLEGE